MLGIFLNCSVIHVLAEDIKVSIDAQDIVFNVAPKRMNNFIYVEAAPVLKNLEYNVSWDPNHKELTAKKNDEVIVFYFSEPKKQTEEEIKNGADSEKSFTNFNFVSISNQKVDTNIHYIMIDQGERATAKIMDSRAMLPIRTIANLTSMKIDWDDHTKTVELMKYMNTDDGEKLVKVKNYSKDKGLEVEFIHLIGREVQPIKKDLYISVTNPKEQTVFKFEEKIFINLPQKEQLKYITNLFPDANTIIDEIYNEEGILNREQLDRLIIFIKDKIKIQFPSGFKFIIDTRSEKIISFSLVDKII